MSQENVDALVRGAGAFNRKDIDALLEEVDAEVEWSVRTRGKGSGAETEAPYFAVIDFKNGKAVRMSTYLEFSEALEAAGLSE